jgi:hypothetical protein
MNKRRMSNTKRTRRTKKRMNKTRRGGGKGSVPTTPRQTNIKRPSGRVTNTFSLTNPAFSFKEQSQGQTQGPTHQISSSGKTLSNAAWRAATGK